MPELPEVETIVRDLQKKVLGRKLIDVWTDFRKMIHLCPAFAEATADRQGFGLRPTKPPSADEAGGQVKKPKDFEEFRKKIKNKKIRKIWRRGKNIIIELSGGLSILIHQKMTGHLLWGNWKFKEGRWDPINAGPLEDSANKFLHLVFWLDDKKQLALSDLRKFAKVELWGTQQLSQSQGFKNLGPEPLKKSFTFQKFEEILRERKSKIKKVLMDQNVISGIGNIYSDEILWEAKILPLRDAINLSGKELKEIYLAAKKILKMAIKLRGESFSDFRDLQGKRGNFDKMRKVYRREGESCSRCGASIKRVKIGGRSAHYCPVCQI